MAKNRTVNLDSIIQESLEEKMNQSPPPSLSSTEAWEQLQSQRNGVGKRKKRSPFHRKIWLSVASIFLLIVSSMLWAPLNGSAFSRWSDLFYNIQGSVVQLFGKVGEGDKAEDAPASNEFYVVEDSEFVSEQMSLSDAQAVTRFPILTPKNIPNAFQLEQVTVLRKKNETSKEVYLNYSGDNGGFTITQMVVSEQFGFGAVADQDDTKVEEVQVNGKKANLLIFKNGVTRLVWMTNSQYFSIEGNLTQDEIMQIANSM